MAVVYSVGRKQIWCGAARGAVLALARYEHEIGQMCVRVGVMKIVGAQTSASVGAAAKASASVGG